MYTEERLGLEIQLLCRLINIKFRAWFANQNIKTLHVKFSSSTSNFNNNYCLNFNLENILKLLLKLKTFFSKY